MIHHLYERNANDRETCSLGEMRQIQSNWGLSLLSNLGGC